MERKMEFKKENMPIPEQNTKTFRLRRQQRLKCYGLRKLRFTGQISIRPR